MVVVVVVMEVAAILLLLLAWFLSWATTGRMGQNLIVPNYPTITQI